jgi:hypothetical protein
MGLTNQCHQDIICSHRQDVGLQISLQTTSTCEGSANRLFLSLQVAVFWSKEEEPYAAAQYRIPTSALNSLWPYRHFFAIPRTICSDSTLQDAILSESNSGTSCPYHKVKRDFRHCKVARLLKRFNLKTMIRWKNLSYFHRL